jgi:uncharacterized coiled-coil DUF342 family protein
LDLFDFSNQNYKDEAQKQIKIIYQLEKERDRYINEASELTQKVLQHMEDVKVREMQIFDYKKKIAEAETKLKQQQVSEISFIKQLMDRAFGMDPSYMKHL